jgi:hypothetical protein
VLGSPPSTPPARCSTQLLGLPRIGASFEGPIQDLDRATRSKGERNGWRSANISTKAPPAPSISLLTTFNATRLVLHATFGTTEAWCHLSRYSPRLGSSNTAERRAERVKNRGDPPARQALGSPPSTRHARRCTRLFGLPSIDAPSKVLLKIGIERHGRRRAEPVKVRQIIEGTRQHARRLAPRLQLDPLGAVRDFWDYRGSVPLSKVLVKIGIERNGRKASRTGQGPPIFRGRRQDRRSLGSPQSTRPDRCSTQPLGLPRLEASF